MIFRNRRYERLLESLVDQLRRENAELFKQLMAAHGHAVEAPRFEPIREKTEKRTALPGVAPQTLRKAGKVPWAVTANRLERMVADMWRKNPAEVAEKMKEMRGESALS